ncbi:methyl-accepting chemotaxis protein [Desulfovibrio legallii]|uniref:Methyl-accepting chemotaxis protein n=2 Tax=Desulfovibrio legallii TaxID=571438 RepID=A0A1G7PHN2_9BACT|nr:methyl-accepting chemotaxis protein [Desulfovibrio legallii]
MKIGLLKKMSLGILLPAIAGLLLVAGVSYKMAEEALRAQIRTDMSALLESQSIGLNGVFLGLTESLKTLSENQRISDYIDAYERGDADVLHGNLAQRADKALRSFTDNNRSVYFAGLLAPDGMVLGHHLKGAGQANEKFVGTSFASRNYYLKARQGEPCVEGIISAATGKTATVAAFPIKREGKVAAIVMAGIANADLAAGTTDLIKVGSKGLVYAYDLKGRMVLHPEAKRMGKDESAVPHVQELLRQGQGRTRFVNAQGEEKGLYYKTMPVEGWILCVEFDRAEIFSPVRAMLSNSALLTLGCVLLVGGIIFLAVRGMVRLLGGISSLAEAAAGGHLELDAQETALLDAARRRGDEFSVLGQAMGHMVGNIKQLLDESAAKTQAAEQAGEEARQATAKAEEAARKAESARREGMLAAAGQLEEVVSVISSASDQLAAQVEQVNRGAAASAQRLGEAATAMNEMNATVQEVAKSAANASNAAETTRSNATNGADVVRGALESIAEVHTVSLALKEDMGTLNEHALSISKIMGVISDIADQTNLLALNAAIEAARAGEAGRGFAVVADEVRKLAEKTMASTNDVGNAIRAIQTSTAQSVDAMDKALGAVETATKYAEDSGAALQQIVESVAGAADQVSAIATASEQQSAASEEINQSIVQVNDMSGQTATAMDEAAKAVAELAAQARRLSDLIAGMKQG